MTKTKEAPAYLSYEEVSTSASAFMRLTSLSLTAEQHAALRRLGEKMQKEIEHFRDFEKRLSRELGIRLEKMQDAKYVADLDTDKLDEFNERMKKWSRGSTEIPMPKQKIPWASLSEAYEDKVIGVDMNLSWLIDFPEVEEKTDDWSAF